MNSLKAKILILISAVLLISVGTLAYFISDTITDNVATNIQENHKSMGQVLQKNIISNLESTAQLIQTLNEAPAVRDLDYAKMDSLFAAAQKANPHLVNVYFSDLEGKLPVLLPHAEVGADFDGRTRQWYQGAHATGNIFYSDVYVDVVSGNPVVAISYPVKDRAGNFKGILAADVSLDFLSDLVNSNKIGQSGFVFLTDNAGKMIAHPDAKLVKESKDMSKDEFVKQALSGTNGFTEYRNAQGVESLVYYSQIPKTGWGLFLTAPKAEAYGLRDAILKKMSLIALVMLVIIMVTVWLATNKLTDIIHGISRGVQQYAKGDFSERIQIKMDTELGILVKNINQMAEQLSHLISDIGKTAHSLASHSQQLAASNEEVGATMQEVASTNNEVAATAESGYEIASKAVEEAHHMGSLAQEGMRAMQQVIEKNQQTLTITTQLGNDIVELTTLSKQIGNITEAITGIADQTNLLALNAAIEAARAGEHGRGFAVVAEEVRKLAEQSSNSSQDIAQLISKIQSNILTVSGGLQRASIAQEESEQLISLTGQTLQQIEAQALNTIGVVEEMAIGIKQTSQGMEQVAASNEQISSTIQQMNMASQELANMANDLQNAVSQFKV